MHCAASEAKVPGHVSHKEVYSVTEARHMQHAATAGAFLMVSALG